MTFETPLLSGRLVRRYQRFLAEIALDSGQVIAAHCPNSGSMKGVNVPGAPVLVSYHPNRGRKVEYTWEMISVEGGWVGINTHVPNRIVAEALAAGRIPFLKLYRHVRAEVKISDHTRIDFVLGQRNPCLLEVKNVTLVENGVAKFPDSVTERGTKHLREMIRHVRTRGRAVAFYVVQHPAGEAFSPADEIDPIYGRTLREAARVGVHVAAWTAVVTRRAITLGQPLPIRL